MITREMRAQIQRVLAKTPEQTDVLFRSNVLSYEVAEITKAIVYGKIFPGDAHVYRKELERGISDALAQIAIICELYGMDFENRLTRGIFDGLSEFLLHKAGATGGG